jgi:hypothetical protein
MTWTTGTGTITFASTSNNRTITTANKTLRNVTFNGLGGRWALQDNLTLSSILTVTSGTLDLNNFNANTLTFTGTGTSARGINFGTSNVNITSTSTATVLNLTDATNFTPSGTGGFRLTGAATGTVTRTSVIGTTGGSADRAPKLNINGAATFALTTGSWVHIVAIADTTSSKIHLYVNGTEVGSGTSYSARRGAASLPSCR